jgi:hypothetical protein
MLGGMRLTKVGEVRWRLDLAPANLVNYLGLLVWLGEAINWKFGFVED